MAESPLFVKTYDLLQWLIPQTTKFPREHRFVMARRVQESAFGFYDLIVRAGLAAARDEKEELLREADVALHRLRLNVRLSKDLALLKDASYAHAAQHLTEIGRLLGGWRKSLD
ncbi:MAG: diversity-generating retroelement protein Avd [Chloroflexota bacterium]